MSTSRPRRALTLVELLVVVAILAVLTGLLLPAVQNVRLSAARTLNGNVARQILLATHHYADAHDGRMPNVNGEPPNPGRSVLGALAPFLECPDEFSPPRGIRFAADPSRGTSVGANVATSRTTVAAGLPHGGPARRHLQSRV